MTPSYYDVIVVGSGAAGLMAAIQSTKNKNTTLLLEKLPQLSSKLKATGGGYNLQWAFSSGYLSLIHI